MPSASLPLESTCLVKQLLNLLAILAALDNFLEIRVAADVDLVDKDVGHGALARQILERVLEIFTIVDLVELDRLVLGVVAVKNSLRVVAIRAV